MSNILLNHFYCLRIMYTSLPFFIFFYFLLLFFFFCAQGGFLAFQIRADIFANYSAPEIFSRSYRVSPNNFIVRHVDRRPRGRDEKGNFTYSPGFTNAYYHQITSHTPLEQIEHFHDNLTHDQKAVINCFDFGLTLVQFSSFKLTFPGSQETVHGSSTE